MRTTPLALLACAVVLLGACGSSSDTTSETPEASAGAVQPDDVIEVEVTVPSNEAKPEVNHPGREVQDLEVTVLIEGDGDPAEAGDTLVVDYVGVRSADGGEFDNSWDRGEPFVISLGRGQVIPGWDEGLVGARAGSRLQLDIPSDLAYGETGAGGDIPPNTSISFVVDVHLVVPAADPNDAPDLDLEPSTGATEVSTNDLIDGTGPGLASGDTAFVQLIVIRGDTLEVLENTWLSGGPVRVNVNPFELLEGFYEGLVGMQTGGRRVITIPYELAFGPEGDLTFGLEPGTDVLLVVDLAAAF